MSTTINSGMYACPLHARLHDSGFTLHNDNQTFYNKRFEITFESAFRVILGQLCAINSPLCFNWCTYIFVPDGRICCWFIESGVVLFFALHSNTIRFLCAPWQHSVAFMASICLHPRSLRACAEPKRASARCGEASLL